VTGLIYIAGTASLVRTTGVPLLMLGIADGQLFASTPRDRRRKRDEGRCRRPELNLTPADDGMGVIPHPLLAYSRHLRLRPTLYYEQSIVSAKKGP
jgi:hypothetical protein